ncbi:hypothetical protein DFQ28_004712 [Apophysomyces sp. BC1034]|nr:hypothetical protein DFQ30_004568 [Apophysomyces sp. BC1015]KAG0178282.1 hypothetical protein DFQ29_003690 [Apophysomyces sp. BC1021]KAG0188555.1 hypothetical protein DFQ28_004712 [Apophysomyces sp. BC1034]
MLLLRNLIATTTAFSALILGGYAFSTDTFQIPITERPVQTQDFKVLTNDAVPGYEVRVKQPQTCETATQYSGYIDNLVTDDHLFFWFIESRNDPRADPTVLWLNGGPGCSSMMGFWMELGPCRVTPSGNETTFNEHSWNSVANVIFLDQPVNVGYSYGQSKIKSSDESARDVNAFLRIFFSEFTEYANSPFHISGESYGGHYLPALATELIKSNKLAVEQSLPLINFESVLIGNGWTNPRTQFKYYREYGCAKDSQYKPLFDEATCKHMKDTYPRCEKLMDLCYKHPSRFTCIPASYYCEKSQAGPFGKTGLNPYDIRRKCEGDTGLCYDLIEAIGDWANRPEVRSQLGVDPEAGVYTGCSESVGGQFELTGDGSKDFSPNVAATLEEGIRVLLYVGDMDWICNWSGNKAWSLEMKWSGQEGYSQAKDEPWHSLATGEQAGEYRTYGNLTFLRVFDAGHMVPYDQPENALDFFGRWLARDSFSD